MRFYKALLLMIAVALMVTPYALYGQHEGKARLKGTVIDDQGNPLADVTIKLYCHRSKSGFNKKTDKKGNWSAMWIRGGTWDIDFEKSGYMPKKISATLKEDGKINRMDATLNKTEGPVIKQELMKDFDKGIALFNNHKYKKAAAVFQAIVKEHPDAFAIYLNVGNCYFELKQYDKAVEAYKKVLEKDADNADALLSIGNSFSNQKNNPEALRWYKKVDPSKLNDPIVLYNIGVFYFNGNNIQAAIDYLRRSVTVKADFKDGWYQLGMAYMNKGDNKASIEALNAYLKIDPDSQKAAQVKEILKALQ